MTEPTTWVQREHTQFQLPLGNQGVSHDARAASKSLVTYYSGTWKHWVKEHQAFWARLVQSVRRTLKVHDKTNVGPPLLSLVAIVEKFFLIQNPVTVLTVRYCGKFFCPPRKI